MTCSKCGSEMPQNAVFCPFCGRRVISLPERKTRRGNGQGCVYRRGKTWTAVVTVRYTDEAKRITRSKSGFRTKKEALEAVPGLKLSYKPVNNDITLKAAYDRMMDHHSQRVSKSTIACYDFAMEHFKALWHVPLAEIKADHFQACLDDCTAGRRTKENMKAAASLICKYGLQNDIIGKNYAEFLVIPKEEQKEREPFTMDEVRQIAESQNVWAGYILVLIFTGFRPNELFKLKKEDFYGSYFIGGSKTEAGKNRIVTIPPVILPVVRRQLAGDSDYIFPAPDGGQMDLSHFRKRYYYPTLKDLNVRPLPPYSCRHTFATMLKNIQGAATDKQRLMGHTSFEMTAHYTHTDVESLKAITDAMVIQGATQKGQKNS